MNDYYATNARRGALPCVVIFLLLMCAVAFGVTGCALVPQYEAKEAHRTMSVPLVFKDEVHATGIKKETDENGDVYYEASDLTHGTTIFSFERNATYKGAKLKVKRESK